METQEIFDKLQAEFGDGIIEIGGESPGDKFIVAVPDGIVDICLYLRDNAELKFDYMSSLSGVQNKDNSFTVVYHLYSVSLKHRVVIKVNLPEESPKLPSVELVWRSADWHEREAFDLYGIEFEGHHNMIRILNPYDWEGFPLRKDYQGQEEYHGVRIPY